MLNAAGAPKTLCIDAASDRNVFATDSMEMAASIVAEAKLTRTFTLAAVTLMMMSAGSTSKSVDTLFLTSLSRKALRSVSTVTLKVVTYEYAEDGSAGGSCGGGANSGFGSASYINVIVPATILAIKTAVEHP